MPFDAELDAVPTIKRELTAAEVRHRIHAAGEQTLVEFRDVTVRGALDLRACGLLLLLRFVRCDFSGAPDVRDADLTGLHLAQCTLPGLRARNLRVRGDVRLRDCEVREQGELELVDTDVGGSVVLTGSRLHHPGGAALHAERLSVGGSLVARGLDAIGELELRGLRAGGDLDLTQARLAGTLSLSGAHAGGDLVLRSARLGKGRPDQPIVEASRVHVDGDLDAAGLAVHGQVLASGARVGGTVVLSGATLAAPGHEVLTAANANIEGDLLITGGRVAGAVQLPGLGTGGDVDLSGTWFSDTPHCDRSVDLRSARIGGDLRLATSGRPLHADGGVSVHGAIAGGALDLTGAVLDAGGPPWVALDATRAEAAEFVLWPAEIRTGTVDLRGARCRVLSAAPSLWQATAGIGLTDFRYDLLRVPDTLRGGEGAALLHRAMAFHQPGPYDQLACALRASGEDDRARTVLSRKHQYHYAAIADDELVFGFAVRLWSGLQRWFSGYGYRPGRAFAALVLLLAALAVVAVGTARAPDSSFAAWGPLTLACVAGVLVAAVAAGAAHRLADRRGGKPERPRAVLPEPGDSGRLE
ncbi:hypothetical protein [Prauserella cavernicola]|uniref:Membrane-associated oxidoreductase n=1 Tax=Prauserella cavernicola TaxID=2800127 RepID=A0A934V6R3_9PSEU|nr:hypothetical protein [Prauserella cavernicola]MBK1785938.1 hypothetical protein [Prauserella cavernicola]